MIKPAITPRRITGNATTGIISAARSGVRNIQGATETISNAPDVTKEQKFGINYVGFFGSKKVGKDLKKSMNTIRDSVGSTFGIAKSLKESVTKGAGVFGFVGKLIGGAAMALPIFALLGVPLLKGILGILAVGGIAGLLSTFGGQIINFVKDKASGFTEFVKDIVGDFFIDRRTSQEFQSIRQQSDARIEEAISSDKGEDRQQAVVEANQNEIKLLQVERDAYKENNKDDRNYNETLKAYDDRIKQLQTGKLDLVKKGPFGGFFDFTGKIATPFVESEAPTVPSFGKKSYVDLSAEKKLESIQALLRSIGNTGDINKARLLYEQEIKKGSLFGKKLNPQELQQANDVIKYLQMFGDDPLGEIDPKKKDLFLKELSSVNINPKELSKKISSLDNINNTSGVSQGGNAGNVAVLPMGNNSNQSLVRNDTGGLTSGPTMKIHPNFDADNFVAPINMANFNVV
tara:strand:- start:20 stop:1399 length:1380 start_codon:yes stop_codon:yes gene_type:complete